jgi:membrane protease YdiL (CAAX protease family)
VAEGEGATIRAIAALLYALLAAAAVVTWVPALRWPRRLEAHGAGALIPLSIILLAYLGARLFAQPIGRGRDAPGLIVSALPMGLVAVAIALAMAATAAVVTGSEGKIAGAGLFIGGSLLIVGAAFGEECLFRGLLQPLLCRAWGPIVGIVAASLAFTAIHVFGGWRDPVSLLNITLAGAWFGLLAWRTGGILAPTLAHAGYNWAEELLFGATPNPA